MAYHVDIKFLKKTKQENPRNAFGGKDYTKVDQSLLIDGVWTILKVRMREKTTQNY